MKVLDFGLAKELRPTEPADATLTVGGRTEIGVVMGTPAYMSPEQVAGRPMDHRTDIFSLGILLYQMASGQRPFEGATSIELASAILRDAPRPLTEIRSDVPADLGRLIRRCLEKDVQRRVSDRARRGQRAARDRSDRGAETADESARLAAARGRERGTRRRRVLGGRAAVQVQRRQSGCGRACRGIVGRDRDGLSRFSYLK